MENDENAEAAGSEGKGKKGGGKKKKKGGKSVTITAASDSARGEEAATAGDSKVNNMGSVSALDPNELDLDDARNTASYVTMLVEKQRHYNVPEHQIFKVTKRQNRKDFIDSIQVS
jgi:hypothetical protein